MDIKSIFGNYRKSTFSLGTALGLLVGTSAVQADDIEIYLQEPPDPVPPNVLFILDESGSMHRDQDSNWVSDSDPDQRMYRLKQAMSTILNDADMGNVIAGIMGYTTDTGNNGPLQLLVRSNFLKVEDHKTTMVSGVNALTPLSYTPTVKALEAGVNWFKGTFTESGPASPATPASPIAGTAADNWCKPNHMVILTDGRPNSNSTSSGGAYGLSSYEGSGCVSDTTSQGQDGRCAREIAQWAYDTDLKTETGWKEQQHIITHAISFDADVGSDIYDFMQSIADAGGGQHYAASSAASLVDAFEAILLEAQESIPYTYSSPAIPFNPDNAALSGDYIYVPMFEPEPEKFWKGNLKKFKLTTVVTTVGGVDVVSLKVKDKDNNDVLDSSYQFVASKDFWSTASDGGEPLQGGVAQHMTGTRNLYTYLGLTDAGGSKIKDLTDAVNRVRDANANITQDMLNVSTATARTNVLNWASWEDAANAHEGEVGAPIHGQPIVVAYSGYDLVLMPTSEGVLEAFREDTGAEVWGFIPKPLLKKLKALRNNNESSKPLYGLDGPITYYESGNKKYVVVGMRRGGSQYYALDITDKTTPKYKWSISKGKTGFLNRVGQTWSKPLFVRMDIPGVAYNADVDGDGTNDATDVLVFGGGYDKDQDNATSRVADDVGNAIFIVNARTGAIIKSISNTGASLNISGMTNGIAGDLLTVDINANGITDRLYATDVGGRVIRVDIPDSGFADRTLSGGIVADINSGVSGYRRFFNTPEVGYFNKGGVQYLAILVGSGFRPEPTDSTVTDRFYMFKDLAVWKAPATYTTVVTSDLYDATANLIQDGSGTEIATAAAALNSASGWYIDFTGSEKAFSKARLYDYAVMFTTYAGERRADTAVCTAYNTSGEARFYAINMVDASAMFSDLDGTPGDLDIGDRSKVLSIPGIPPAPTLVYPDYGASGGLGHIVKAIVGLEGVAEWPDRFHAIYWEEVIE